MGQLQACRHVDPHLRAWRRRGSGVATRPGLGRVVAIAAARSELLRLQGVSLHEHFLHELRLCGAGHPVPAATPTQVTNLILRHNKACIVPNRPMQPGDSLIIEWEDACGCWSEQISSILLRLPP